MEEQAHNRQADMTLQSFQKYIRKQSKSRIIFEYFFCTLFVFIGAYLIYHYYKVDYKSYMYVFPTLMILVGCRGFFRIPKSLNQAFVIDSLKQIPQKLESIKLCFSNKEKIELEENGLFLKLKYQYLFDNKIVIDLYIDTDKVMFIVRREDIQPMADYLDLGATKKEAKIIYQDIKACL